MRTWEAASATDTTDGQDMAYFLFRVGLGGGSSCIPKGFFLCISTASCHGIVADNPESRERSTQSQL